jgi:hypothetical protein
VVLFIRSGAWVVTVPFYDLCLICRSTGLRVRLLDDGKVEEIMMPLGDWSLT